MDEGPVIKSQDVVDELEAQFDPSLERVKGIRILGQRVFLCMKDGSSVSALLDRFGQGKGALMIKGRYGITFFDGSQG